MPKSAATIREELRQSRPFRSASQEAYVALLRTADDSKRFLAHLLEKEDVTGNVCYDPLNHLCPDRSNCRRTDDDQVIASLLGRYRQGQCQQDAVKQDATGVGNSRHRSVS